MEQKKFKPIFSKLEPSLEKVAPDITCKAILGDCGWLLKSTLSPAECQAVIRVTEQEGYEDAEKYCFMYVNRINDRLMSDDSRFAQFLWERVREFVPEQMDAFSRSWRVSALNSRFRICRYMGGKGHHFGPHCDGIYPESENRMSLLTCMIYLNDASEFEGGLTNFLKFGTKDVTLSIQPEPGLCVIFKQMEREHCYHEGTEVKSGVKYILRTDVMYDAVTPKH